MSIFVNPTQFAPHEDLARYPRDEAGDLKKLAEADADLVWAPSVDEMYPDGTSTRVEAGSAAADLEGDFRPHHFGGVATVCCKLFNQVTPDFAIFGEKDYQQLAVLRQMVRDLDMPLKLIAAPISREKDGLALSSRNAYLTRGRAGHRAGTLCCGFGGSPESCIRNANRGRDLRGEGRAHGRRLPDNRLRRGPRCRNAWRGNRQGKTTSRPRRRMARQDAPDRQRGGMTLR